MIIHGPPGRSGEGNTHSHDINGRKRLTSVPD